MMENIGRCDGSASFSFRNRQEYMDMSGEGGKEHGIS